MFKPITPYWSMISSLLHLVDRRSRVYYTLTNFRRGTRPFEPTPPPINTPMQLHFTKTYINTEVAPHLNYIPLDNLCKLSHNQNCYHDGRNHCSEESYHHMLKYKEKINTCLIHVCMRTF